MCRSDHWLLHLERVRILDMAHSWTQGTHNQYQTKLRVLERFQNKTGAPILGTANISSPPSGPEIPLNWAMLDYSLQPSNPNDPSHKIKWGTVRALRSAFSQWTAWNMTFEHPGQLLLSPDDKLSISPLRCTDSFENTLFAKGLSARMGTSSKPSHALLPHHVKWIDADLHRRYAAATDAATKCELARAGLANLLFWLGWLRSAEGFSLAWEDFFHIPASSWMKYSLHPDTGMILVTLLPETKSSRTLAADVAMADRTFSGLNIGLWFRRLRVLLGLRGESYRSCKDCVFRTPTGRRWTSKHFRDSFIYPALYQMQADGDPTLSIYDDKPGNTIRGCFPTLHMYRRGTRTECQRTHHHPRRSATTAEVYEHARWQKKRDGEDIDKQYMAPTLHDRQKLTLYCL